MNNAVSTDSPIGTALMGKMKGETALVEAPMGVIRLKIVSIART